MALHFANLDVSCSFVRSMHAGRQRWHVRTSHSGRLRGCPVVGWGGRAEQSRICVDRHDARAWSHDGRTPVAMRGREELETRSKSPVSSYGHGSLVLAPLGERRRAAMSYVTVTTTRALQTKAKSWRSI